MGAFFADVKQWGVYMDYNYTPNKDLVGWSNDHPFPPELIVDSPYLKRRQAGLLRQIDQIADRALRDAGKAGSEAFSQWSSQGSAYLAKYSDGWNVLSPVGLDKPDAADKKPIATLAADHAVLLGPSPAAAMNAKRPVASDRVVFALNEGNIASIRLELLPHESHRDSVSRGGGSSATVQVTFAIRSESGTEERVPVYFADADLKDDRFANGYPIIGIKDAWKTSAANSHARHTGIYVLEKPLAVSQTDQLIVSVNRNGPGCIRIAASPIATLNPVDASSLDALKDALAASHPEDQPAARLAYALEHRLLCRAYQTDPRLHKEVLECRDGKSPVVVTMAVQPQLMRSARPRQLAG